MKKLFTSFVVVLAIFASTGQAQAQLPGIYGMPPFGTWLPCSSWTSWFSWFGGYPWIRVPGCEAQMVVWGNQNMVWNIGRQQPYHQPYYQPPPGQYPVSPAPYYQPYGQPYPQQQYVVVRVPKPREHKWHDVAFASALGAGVVGGITRSAEGAVYGALGGFGGGGLYANHEYDEYVIPVTLPPQQPTPQQPPQQSPSQPQGQYQPPSTGYGQPSPIVVEPTSPRLTGIEFVVRNENPATIVVEIPDGRRATVGPRGQARVRTPDIRVFLVQQDGRGSFDEFEIELETTQDSTLPGWRIPPKVRLKNP